MLRPLFLAVAIAASGAAARVYDSLPAVPPGWTFVREALPSDPVSLKIALRQLRADELEQVVLDVSTPGHVRYGKHLTRDELRAYTAPSAAAVDSVSAWLEKYGIATASVDNDWVSFSTTAATADALLDARFAWYQFKSSKEPVLRTLSYSVPDALAVHVDLVQPTTRFGQLAPRRSTIFEMHPLSETEADAALHALQAGSADEAKVDAVDAVNSADASTCTGGRVTPACIKTLYGINYTVAEPAKNLVGFASYLEEYARYSDLDLFETNFVPEASGQSFSVSLINGGLNDQTSSDDSGEANLDVQYILGVSHPVPVVEYSTAGRGPFIPVTGKEVAPGTNEPYLEFLTYILALNDSSLPQTLSTSYGEDEQSVPQEYALKICNLFMQLGARGVSVLFSSGDSGPGDTCVRISDNTPYFEPTFPAACPYVTAVGATYQTSPEVAVSFSSGGFSTLHPRPAWQDAAVPAYLESIGSTYSSFFNASNRGFPDVSAQGNNFLVYDQGVLSGLSGTSASSPVFAGVVALLNAARQSQGISPLGFLNPWLYNQSAAFNDITGGSSTGCTNTTYFKSRAHWNATAGWDPVTGLGTPNFPALLAAAAPGVANA